MINIVIFITAQLPDKANILPSICFLLHGFEKRFGYSISVYDTTAHSGGKAGLLLVQILCLSVLFLTYLAIIFLITRECFGWQNNDKGGSCFILLTVENRSIHAAPSGIVVNNLFNRSLLIIVSVITHPNIFALPTGRHVAVIAR